MASKKGFISAQYSGTCRRCGQAYAAGDQIFWSATGFTAHAACERTFKAARKEKFNLDDVMPDMPEASTSVPAFPEFKAELLKDVVAIMEERGTAPKVDMDEVLRMVVAEVAKRVAPQTVDVKVTAGTEVKTVSGAHFFFERLVRLVAAGIPVYLWGPAGTGKTTAAIQAAEAIGKSAEVDTLDPSTFRSMVQGYMTPEGKAVHTAFSRCWTEGKVYCADEADNAPGHVQTLYNSALANKIAALAWGNASMKDGFGFIATGNTPFRPTRSFPDRRPGSAAFIDRLYFIYWPLDVSIECRAAGLPVPPAPQRSAHTCNAQDWTKFVQALRSWTIDNMPTLMITPRATLLGIKALSLGESVQEVADALIFRGCDDEMRAKALSAVPLP